MSDIKFNNLDSFYSILNIKKPTPVKEIASEEALEDSGISIQLSSMANLSITEMSESEDIRVMDMKRRIESNNYRVNTDVLAEKLLPTLLKSMG